MYEYIYNLYIYELTLRTCYAVRQAVANTLC